MELLLLPVIVFAAVMLFAVALARRHEHLSGRHNVLSRMSAPPPGSLQEFEDIDITRQVRPPERALVGNLLSKVRLTRRLEENLWQAGLYIKASDALALMLALGLAGGAAGAVWSRRINPPALAAATGMALLPLVYIRWRKRRRLKSFDQQLPEILDLLKSSLDAGHTLQRALQVTVEEFSDPASSELRIVLEQNRLGVPLARALEYMLQRIPDENLRFLVVAVKIQTEVGSSLGGIIAQLALTIRDRQRMEMKVRALTAQPRLAALIGGLMPVFLVVALRFVSPDSINMLFHDPTGIKLTKVVAVLEMLALITISRLTRLDY